MKQRRRGPTPGLIGGPAETSAQNMISARARPTSQPLPQLEPQPARRGARGRAARAALASLAGACAALSLAACSWLKSPPPRDPVEVVDAETIRVYKDALENLQVNKAESGPFPDLLSLMGKISVTEDRTTIVPARVAGRVEAIYFASGEYVAKGQVLATLFSPDFLSAKEEFLQALKQLPQASADAAANGSKGADPSDFSSLAQMSRKKLATMGLEAEDIEAIAKEKDGADNGKALLSVRAPRSGVLIQKAAALGNLQNVGDTLFVIGNLDKVWFSGDIYPEDVPKIKKDQDVFINAVGVEKPLYGKVSFISPLVDPNTRSIKIRALMDNPKRALKADEYVQGNVVLLQKSALTIPTKAIVRTPDGAVVYKKMREAAVENAIGSVDFKKISVVLGKEQNGMTEVASGLSDGDSVVTDGSWLLDAALTAAKGPASRGGGK